MLAPPQDRQFCHSFLFDEVGKYIHPRVEFKHLDVVQTLGQGLDSGVLAPHRFFLQSSSIPGKASVCNKWESEDHYPRDHCPFEVIEKYKEAEDQQKWNSHYNRRLTCQKLHFHSVNLDEVHKLPLGILLIRRFRYLEHLVIDGGNHGVRRLDACHPRVEGEMFRDNINQALR